MTVEGLLSILKDNDIPRDALLMSDSGWECDPTHMDGVFYNESTNTVVFTQEAEFSKYSRLPGWVCLNKEDP